VHESAVQQGACGDYQHMSRTSHVTRARHTSHVTRHTQVCVLMLEKERCWLVQVASVVLNKQHASSMAASQGDVTGVYEGYKHNGIALSAISSGECVVVPSVKAHAGYDSRLDAMAGLQGRNCLAAPIMAGDSKASARCVGVMFATNKAQGGFQGGVCDVYCIFCFSFAQELLCGRCVA